MERNKIYSSPVNIPRILGMLIYHEGLRTEAYRCSSGKVSIGAGHNLEAKPIRGLGAGSKICGAYAIFILAMDLEDVLEELEERFAWVWGLDEARFAVVVDMLFNLGLPRFRTFKKFLKALFRREYSKAADEMLDSKWASQVQGRAVRLSEMMRTGEWPKI